MNGGLFKSASRFALVAAAGILAGGVAAQAADLGGNCCADLEERVAELEATTARKGNRKVKLTVSGQVNQALMFWDDGFEKNTYQSDNENSRTRFRFVGDAKINADWSAGYLLEIGVARNTSDSYNQLNDDAGGDSIAIRHTAWWLDHKSLGRVWLGQTSSASDGIASINLANSGVSTTASIADFGAGMLLRRGAGAATSAAGATWGNLTPVGGYDLGDGSRRNVVKYVSPTVAGLNFQSAWGEDDFWDVALRYAGEFAGFRLAAGVAYQSITDTEFGCTGGLGASATTKTADCETIGGSGTIMHVATGLFVHGAAGQFKDNLVQGNTAIGIAVGLRESTSTYWYINAGIEQNWLGFGKTTLFGEYYDGDMGTSVALTNTARTAVAANGFTAANIASSEVQMWGVGMVQSIDAAAMDLYLGYRTYSADLNTTTGKQSADDLKMFYMGGIIRF